MADECRLNQYCYPAQNQGFLHRPYADILSHLRLRVQNQFLPCNEQEQHHLHQHR